MKLQPPLLIIGEQSSTLLLDHTNLTPLATHSLSIGWQYVLPGPIRRSPPRADDLERAIQYVEDTIMPVLTQFQTKSDVLAVELPDTLKLQPILDAAENMYSIDEVENAFRRLCEIVEGSPIGNDTALIAPEIVSVLLILREVMHHGGFHTLQVVV